MQSTSQIVFIFGYIIDISRLQVLCKNQSFMSYSLHFSISVFNLG